MKKNAMPASVAEVKIHQLV